MENDSPQINNVPPKHNAFLIPVSIILAGVLIGGAVLYKNNDSTTNNNIANTKTDPVQKSLIITPVGDGDHVLGNADARVTFIEYSDMECPFCKTFHQTMRKVIDEYGKGGKIAWAYRHYPIDQLHPKARKEAEATECIAELGGNQKFWLYLDTIFEITPSNNGLDESKLLSTATTVGINATQFSSCLESGRHADKVSNNISQALKSGGNGTPHTTLVLKSALSGTSKEILESNFNQIRDQQNNLLITISPDNKSIIMRGSMPYDIIKTILDEILK